MYTKPKEAVMKHFILVFLFALSIGQLSAHCQIPCGIYHDQMVIKGLEEDIETLTKSVNEINTNAKAIIIIFFICSCL